jgi:hypothetical protein
VRLNSKYGAFFVRSIFFIYLTIAALCIVSAGDGDDSAVSFSYAFIQQNEKNELYVIDTTQLVTKLKTGDRLKIYFEAFTRTYLYLFLLDSKKELFFLFPDNFYLHPPELRFFQADYIVHNKYFIPSPKSWLVLDDHAGIEEFYLIASKNRLPGLEQSVSEYYGTMTQNEKDDAARKQRRQKVLDELRDLRKQNSAFVGFNEKPVSVSGEFRGVGEEMEFTANRITAHDFYAKTIRISH